MCQTDTQWEEKEHRLLQKNRMVDSQPIASHLRKHANALGRIGHARELLDGNDSRTSNYQHKTDVYAKIANHTVHTIGLLDHLVAIDRLAPKANIGTIVLGNICTDTRSNTIRGGQICKLGIDLLGIGPILVIDQQRAVLQSKSHLVHNRIGQNHGAGI